MQTNILYMDINNDAFPVIKKRKFYTNQVLLIW